MPDHSASSARACLVRLLQDLAEGTPGAPASAPPSPATPEPAAALYLGWDGGFLTEDGSMPGALLNALTALLPRPGTLDVLTPARDETMRLERAGNGTINLLSRPGLDIGPHAATAGWPAFRTLVWIPALASGVATALKTHLSATRGVESLLHLPASLGLAVVEEGQVSRSALLVTAPGSPQRTLTLDGEESTWLVAAGEVSWPVDLPADHPLHRPFGKALELRWATPLSGPALDEKGTLQAESPFTLPSPLPGHLRAPWHLSDDFPEDPWNAHLFREAAAFMAREIARFPTDTDPARALDLLPKADDDKSTEPHPLVAALWQKLQETPLVPDATGALRIARQLWSHPYEDARLVECWQELAPLQVRRHVIHSACLTPTRTAALRRLAGKLEQHDTESTSPALLPWSLENWLGRLVPAGPEATVRVLLLARLCQAITPLAKWAGVRGRLTIIRTVGDDFLTAGETYIPVEGGFIPEDLAPVHHSLLEDEQTRRILIGTLGVMVPPGPAERLVEALGPQAETLLTEALGSRVPQGLMPAMETSRLAELALGFYGNAVLSRLADTLRKAGQSTPRQWGRHGARTFVRQLGFPESFATSASSGRPAEEFSMGPDDLPELHDFQDEVLRSIRALVEEREPSKRRAVVSLPTGGGKTRVTVQAAVDLILKPQGPQCRVLWVAQSDELCEQALQTFRYLWTHRGRPRTELRMVRLWGGNNRPSAPVGAEPVVVVASIQTLERQENNPDLDWLKRCGMLIFDECHHAIAPTYTGVLSWLNDPPEGAGLLSPVVLGLSATPFRNVDEQTEALAERFEQRLFPMAQEHLHERLLNDKVLARAIYRFPESDAVVSEDELKDLETDGKLNAIEFENRVRSINGRLANDPQRNALIVDEIARAPQRSVLLFANSPEHSRLLTAMFIARGIPAAAIDAETPRPARRWLLDRFQRHEIRVLCNHSVLTTGFDAPKVDMVFISRQVFSPVLYMQMVGRGLRGEKNGGTVECQIVTVRDNWMQFGDRLAWHYWKDHYTEG